MAHQSRPDGTYGKTSSGPSPVETAPRSGSSRRRVTASEPERVPPAVAESTPPPAIRASGNETEAAVAPLPAGAPRTISARNRSLRTAARSRGVRPPRWRRRISARMSLNNRARNSGEADARSARRRSTFARTWCPNSMRSSRISYRRGRRSKRVRGEPGLEALALRLDCESRLVEDPLSVEDSVPDPDSALVTSAREPDADPEVSPVALVAVPTKFDATVVCPRTVETADVIVPMGSLVPATAAPLEIPPRSSAMHTIARIAECRIISLIPAARATETPREPS
jgi:hypothetical protein